MAGQSYRVTQHASSAMARRGIGPDVLARVMEAPDSVLDDRRPGRRIFQAVQEFGEPPTRALIRAIVDVAGSPPAVVTVYATTQFRRYGASG